MNPRFGVLWMVFCMIETLTLSPGVTLRGVRDDRFRQACLSVQLAAPMAGETAAENALIPAVLLRGTRRDPDLRAMTRHLDDLYGASVSTVVRRLGDYQTVGLYCALTDSRYALPGDRILEPMIDFLREILRESPTEKGGFLPDFVEGERRNLISLLDSERNDKRAYAMSRLIRTVGAKDSFGVPRLGTREALEKIRPAGLYRRWENLLQTAPAEIFYAGSAPLAEVAEMLRPLLPAEPRTPLPPQTDLTPAPGQDIVQTMDVTQGQLCLAFVTPITLRDSQFAAMQLLNAILGAGLTSKLFTRLREELSLCYSVSSGYYSAKGILTVYAGIDPENEPRAREEILAQLEDCKNARFTPQEIQSGKEALCSGLRAVADSPSALEGYYLPGALTGLRWTPEEYAAAVRAVTAEDLTRAARTLRYHSSVFLKGEG